MSKKNKENQKLMKKFNLSEKSITRQKTLKDIMDNPPGFVLAKVINNVTFDIDHSHMKVLKNEVLALPFYLYKRLRQSNDGKNIPILEPFAGKMHEYIKKYTGKENLDNKKLLVVRTGGIGDIIFTQSIIKMIKEKHPTCTINYATIKRHMPALGLFPRNLVEAAVPIPFNLQILKDHDYHLFFEGVIERCEEAEKVNCYDLFSKVAGFKFDPKYNPDIHLDKFLYDSLKPFIPPKTIMLQYRASSILRSLPTPKIIDIIIKLQELGFYIGLIDSPENSVLVQKFIDTTPAVNPIKTLNLAQYSNSIMHGAALCALCDGAITIDSSFSHIASAMNKPVLTVYGPFKGDLRMKYYPTGTWIEPDPNWNECNKFPCFFHEDNAHQCPYLAKGEAPGCINSISPDDIVNKFMEKYKEVNNVSS